MPRGRVVGEMPIGLGLRTQLRRRGVTDFHEGCRQCTDAHHTAAFRSGRLVVIVRRGRCFVSDQCLTVRTVRFAEMAMSTGTFVGVAVLMNVLRSAVAGLMNVNDPGLVARVREARRHTRPIAQCKREARRRYAKQIDQGEQPSRPQSLRFGQTHEHLALCLAT